MISKEDILTWGKSDIIALGLHSKTKAFVDAFPVTLLLYLQAKGPETIQRFYPETPTWMSYPLPEWNLHFSFAPSDFTQVNQSLNESMIHQALTLLDVQSSETVLDLFCGLGNFSLPLARKAKWVVGVEGDLEMTRRASMNAENNKISNVEFHAENLFEALTNKAFFKDRTFDKVLLDPPRAGALEICTELAQLKEKKPKRIVYVSCNPATLARDAGVLIKRGYVLKQAGVMDMFPHTEHVESMAVFEAY